MVITSLKITPERNSAVDFSVPFLETGITIIVSIREGAISPTAFLGEQERLVGRGEGGHGIGDEGKGF